MPTWLIEDRQEKKTKIVSVIKDQNGTVVYKGGIEAVKMLEVLHRPGVILTCTSTVET